MSYTIIGSGPTGLTLAYILALNNYNVTIIEYYNNIINILITRCGAWDRRCKKIVKDNSMQVASSEVDGAGWQRLRRGR